MTKAIIAFLCLLCCAPALLCAQAAPDSGAGLTLRGYTQLWYLYEQAANGKQQDVSGDLGAQEASGFSFNRVRLSADARWEHAGMNVQIRLEGGSLGLLDACSRNRCGPDEDSFGVGSARSR